MPKKFKSLPPKPTKQRLKSDFNQSLNIKIHPDGKIARERLAKMFRGQYKKSEIDTFVYLAFEQTVRDQDIKKGDDLEFIFDIEPKI